MSMQRIWNFIYYSTWQNHNKVAEITIVPFIYLFNQIPFFHKNWFENGGEQAFNNFIKNKKKGSNILFSDHCMLMSTSIIYFIIFLNVFYFFKINATDYLLFYFCVIFAFAYITNYFLIWRKNVYLKYFSEFASVEKKSLVYLPSVFFHISIFTIAVLSIFWTIGFNL